MGKSPGYSALCIILASFLVLCGCLDNGLDNGQSAYNNSEAFSIQNVSKNISLPIKGNASASINETDKPAPTILERANQTNISEASAPNATANISLPQNVSNIIIAKNRTAHFQYQDTRFNELKNLDVDYLVVDFDESKLSSSQLGELKSRNITVLSYLSIGEAEDYRPYWQDDWSVGSPSFIYSENPDWPGNYKVEYWDSDWQSIILGKASEIKSRGYDGVFLDVVDAYLYHYGNGRSFAPEEMKDFVIKIKKRVGNDFLVVPNNAAGLYSYYDYRSSIDGLGAESTWYGEDDLQDAQSTQAILNVLDQATKDGKFVLAIDYPSENSDVCDFYRRCWGHGFVCTVSDVLLESSQPVNC